MYSVPVEAVPSCSSLVPTVHMEMKESRPAPGIVFTAQHCQPSILKRALGDISESFSRDNIAITVHDAEISSRGEIWVSPAQVEDPRTAMVMLNEAFFEASVYSLYMYQDLKKVSHTIKQLPGVRPSAVRALVNRLVTSGALPGSKVHVALPRGWEQGVHAVDAMLRLEMLGYVAAPEEDAGTPLHLRRWALTSSGLDRVVVSSVVGRPAPAMAHRGLAAVEDWSAYELMTFLAEHGWRSSPWEKNARLPPSVVLQPVGSSASPSSILEVETMQWFYRPWKPEVAHAYLLAMVHAEKYAAVLQRAGMLAIPHGQSVRYYQGLVDLCLGKLKDVADLSELTSGGGIVFEAELPPRSPKRKRQSDQADPAAHDHEGIGHGVHEGNGRGIEDHADAKKAKNASHPKTHSWGPFTILFRPSVGRSGKLTLAAWEATCRIKSHCGREVPQDRDRQGQ